MTWLWPSAASAAPGLLALAAALIALASARRSLAETRGLARAVRDLAARPHSGASPASRPREPARPAIRRDRAASSAVPGPTLIAVPSMAATGAGALADEAAGSLARRFRAIWDLADSGRPAAEIARGTGQPIGQVELILALRRPSDAHAPGEAVPRG